jgi:hypothetical protein
MRITCTCGQLFDPDARVSEYNHGAEQQEHFACRSFYLNFGCPTCHRVYSLNLSSRMLSAEEIRFKLAPDRVSSGNAATDTMVPGSHHFPSSPFRGFSKSYDI